MTEVLDVKATPETTYCVPLWVRDEQIKLAIQRPIPRLQPYPEGQTRSEHIALVGFGPSLNDTWHLLKDFKYIVSCSGAHKFLVDRGIIPTYHIELDPRAHKVELIGQPHPDVQYLIASTCHPAVFDHLRDYNTTLWHIFDSAEEGLRVLPQNEWAITGGCSVGSRMFTIARFFGFTNMHVFGIDGNEGESGKHAAYHPSQPKKHNLTTYCDVYGCPDYGTVYKTTPSMLAPVTGLWHELDLMPDVTTVFYGNSLAAHMSRHYIKKDVKRKVAVGYHKPETISTDYRELNKQLHQSNIAYGVGGGKHADIVQKLLKSTESQSVLDYGCGKGYLAKALPFPIWEYDPAIPGKDENPKAADLVVCTDVLEHIEPDKLLSVLADLQRVTKKVGYFTIHTGPAQKTLPDGRNTHLIQQKRQWWKNRLKAFFTIGMMKEVGAEIHCVVAPKIKEKHA